MLINFLLFKTPSHAKQTIKSFIQWFKRDTVRVP